LSVLPKEQKYENFTIAQHEVIFSERSSIFFSGSHVFVQFAMHTYANFSTVNATAVYLKAQQNTTFPFKMTSLTAQKVMQYKSLRVKCSVLMSRLFPNVKDLLLTLVTTLVTFLILMSVQKKTDKVSGTFSSTLGFPTNQEGRVTLNGAWCWFADPRAIHFKGKEDECSCIQFTSEQTRS